MEAPRSMKHVLIPAISILCMTGILACQGVQNEPVSELSITAATDLESAKSLVVNAASSDVADIVNAIKAEGDLA